VSAAVAGLVVALPEECRSLTDKRVRRGECFALGEARLVCIAGIGGDNARHAARRLIDDGASGLLSWGCAAALSPSFKPGDLCLPEEILDARGERRTVSPVWHERARKALEPDFDPRTGPLLTTDCIAATATDKHALAAQFRAVAVDMESAAVAAVARERDVPFLAVRAIADPVDMALPAAVLHATDAHGTVHPSLLLRHTLLHPGQALGLLRLASHFRAALRTLTGAARRMGGDCLLGRTVQRR
jgi:adenosylhomocysteine nucleosidase